VPYRTVEVASLSVVKRMLAVVGVIAAVEMLEMIGAALTLVTTL
jgi:hypothetical protein